MNLLIVDDDKFSIEALKQTVPWSELGISHIFSCYNIQDAKELLENEPIHLMICDIEMPFGSGLDLLAWIDENHLLLVSILLTCHPDFSYAVTALEHNAFSYLLKPFKLEEVCSTVKDAITQVHELQKISMLQKYEKKLNANQLLVREQFWFQLITGMYQDCDASYIQWECASKNITFEEDTLWKSVLFCITSDAACELSISLLNFTVKNVLCEIFSFPEDVPPPITFSRKHYVLLFPDTQSFSKEDFLQKCNAVVSFFHEKYALTMQYFTAEPVTYPFLFEQVSSLNAQAETFFSAVSDKTENGESVIEQSIRLIKENPDITREELAARAFLHPDYFAKLFKKKTGKALSDYLADIKLEEAKYLLTQTPNSISSIAAMMGYSNFSYFSHMFRKKTGLTPSEYRKKYYGSITV